MQDAHINNQRLSTLHQKLLLTLPNNNKYENCKAKTKNITIFQRFIQSLICSEFSLSEREREESDKKITRISI
jgi:hypothetical protein